MVTPSFLTRIIAAAAILLLSSLQVAARDTDTRPGMFDPMVRSLTLYNPDAWGLPPLLRLGSDDRLQLNFDIIGDSHRYLRARLVHCNADWQPSRLVESEFAAGFNEAQLDDFGYSSNTYIHYVNYNFIFPTPDFGPLASGNYLIQVFDEEDPDSLLLQTRFAVSENTAPLSVGMTTRTDFGFNSEWQQLDIGLDTAPLGNLNPYQDIVLTIQQNDRPESLRTVTRPMRVDGTHAFYEHDPGLIYPASNEFRRFETVRADYNGMHTDSVRFDAPLWQAFLSVDTPRNDSQYSYDRTQYGRFMVDEYSASDPNLGADYINVHFTLKVPETPGIQVHVDGDLNSWRHDDRTRMSYDHTLRAYTLAMPLKQGSYNYQYVVLKETPQSSDGTSRVEVSPAPVEGDRYETANLYTVKAFVRTPGSRADRLISVFNTN